MKQIILSIIIVAGAVGIFFGFTQPLLDEISGIQKNKEALEGVLSGFYDLREAKDRLIEQYNSISSGDLEKLEEIVPATVNEGDLIVQFENLTKDRGLLLKQIAIQHAQEDRAAVLLAKMEPYKSVPITLTVDGSYSSFKSFLEGLERSLRIIDIKSVGFSAGERDSYEFSISAVAYFQNPK